MPRAKLSDAKPISTQQGGRANLSDTSNVNSSISIDDWKKIPRSQRDQILNSLPEKERDNLMMNLGLYGPMTGLSVSAPLQADWKDIFSTRPGAQAIGVVNSIPWMKEKAAQFLNWGSNQLSTAGGVLGGIAGGAIGEAADPAGGGIPGGIIGSSVGGGAGDASRQFIRHVSGLDRYDDPENKTLGARALSVGKEAAAQGAGEITGQLAGKILRPTLDRSLSKLYFAGKLNYGDPLAKGDLETVIHDLLSAEAKKGGKVVSVGDFLSLIKDTKNDIGQQVDRQLALPFNQNGVMTTLGKAHANPTDIVNAINAMATADPSIIKDAALNKAGPEAAYLERIRKESLKFQQTPWTYEELTSKRIRLNQELAPLYELPRGEQRKYLLEHPDLAFKKAEADAIRDVVYPQMDRMSGSPYGTTAELQSKRGSLMSLENQVSEHLGDIKTKSRQAKGAPLTQKANISSYGTSTGKPGFAIHRLTSLVHTPNVERQADRKVAQAFGNTVGQKVRKTVSSPGGSDKIGNEILSLPLRSLILHPLWKTGEDNRNPPNNKEDEDYDFSNDPGPQSSVSGPKDLIEKVKQLNPAAQGQTEYAHVAVNPQTGHRVGSQDGQNWYDLQTGARMA